MNVILFSTPQDYKYLFTTRFPCDNCAKSICQTSVVYIIYIYQPEGMATKDGYINSRKYLQDAGKTNCSIFDLVSGYSPDPTTDKREYNPQSGKFEVTKIVRGKELEIVGETFLLGLKRALKVWDTNTAAVSRGNSAIGLGKRKLKSDGSSDCFETTQHQREGNPHS